MIDNEVVRRYSRGEALPDDGTRLWQSLQEVARLVIGRHFWYLTPDQKEEGMSEAVCGALEGLKQPWVDLDHNSPLNYVYTRMRNCLTNFFRAQFRVDVVDVPSEIFDRCEDVVPGPSDAWAVQLMVEDEYKELEDRLKFFGQECTTVDTFFDTGVPELKHDDVMSVGCAAFVVAMHKALLDTSYLPKERE